MIVAIPGWLEKITNWFKETFTNLWESLKDFLNDLLVTLAGVMLDVAATAIEAIQVPNFIATYSLSSLLGQGGGEIAWIISTFQIGTGFTIIAAGWAFRLLRKLFTLGQW